MNWLLKGDSPTAYFFSIANGRRRRCTIDSLLINGVRISYQNLIMSHVVEFFSSFLSAKLDSGFKIAPSFWNDHDKISAEENEALMTPLSEEEIFDTISKANVNSASGPDGFSIPFFRKF